MHTAGSCTPVSHVIFFVREVEVPFTAYFAWSVNKVMIQTGG